MGSYARFQRKGLAGPPMPSPLASSRLSVRVPATTLRTERPMMVARRALRIHLGKFQASMTAHIQWWERRSNALLWSARRTAWPCLGRPSGLWCGAGESGCEGGPSGVCGGRVAACGTLLGWCGLPDKGGAGVAVISGSR
eukprot:1772912-Heterocapsa_arctica.AAC.1